MAKAKKSFERTRAVTVPLLKPELDVPFFVRIDSPMRMSKPIKQDGKQSMEPATVCNVTNLETDEPQELIVPAVLKGIFEEQYVETDEETGEVSNNYVGLAFEIVKRPKEKNKRYHKFEVYEVNA